MKFTKFDLVYDPNFIVNRRFWFFGPNLFRMAEKSPNVKFYVAWLMKTLFF